MTTDLRIGLLTPGWPGHNTPNGIATSVYNLAMGLKGIGVTPVIITKHIDGVCPLDIPVVKVPHLGWSLQHRLRAKIKDTSAVHRHWAGCLAAAAQQAKAEHGLDVLVMEETNGWAALARFPVPVAVALHGPWILLSTMASLGAAEDTRREDRERKGFEAAVGLIAPSRNALEAVETSADVSRIPKIVLPNTLSAEAAAPLAAEQPVRDILFVGRVDFLKGVDTVLAAFTRVAQARPEARLTFVGPDKGFREGGEGPEISIETLLAALPDDVSARLDHKGALSREEVSALRQTHAIALTASRYENLNYTLLEAMAAGQAVVSTAVGGPAEVLETEKTALMVPPGDAEAMACALLRLIDDAALTRELGMAARAKLTTDFNPEAAAQQAVAFLKSILAQRAG